MIGESRQFVLHQHAPGETLAELRQALADHCVLFTDLANPTANAVYQRLGFEPVSEHLEIDFV